MRAFARVLDVSPPHLSQLISGKRPLTYSSAKKIAKGLGLSPRETEQFLDYLNTEKVKRKREDSEKKKILIEEDQFKLICDWYHLGILSLAKIKENRFDARWISKRLGIRIKDAADARDRLIRLNLIERNGESFKRTISDFQTADDQLSSWLQKSHIQNLLLAKDRLETTPVHMREYSTLTMAIDPSNILKAKKIMRRFEDDIADILESGNKSEVYTLALQLFPVTSVH